MIKQFLTLALLAVTTLLASAQTPLPLNPAVKHGTLPNGLNYYILHNEEPKERVNFYIAQKVGSTLETPEQLGLAHFLEHMAFNGTANYPGKNMLNYLQSKGIRFGADINAYTSFDETVYNIDNIPSTDKALVDSVLLVLYDWSGSILLEEAEIEAERGVIEEEWRSRNSGMQRMYEAMLPAIFSEYQYQQMPIGKMEVVRNFEPQALRDYYHKWYRPDQQGIIIVGDIDADEMEQKVIDLFSKIPMPENAAPREYPEVSDNEKPIYFYFTDKELQMPRVTVSFKSDKTPFEYRNTMENYLGTQVVEILISQMINNRLDEYSKKSDCKYAFAGVYFSDFYVANTKSAFNISVIAKDDVRAAYDDAIAIVAQACKTGFMQSELVRARDQLLANYEQLYNERNNTKTATLAKELCRHFTENEPAPGIETEYMMMQQVLPMLPLAAYNETASMLLTEGNQVIVVSEPTHDGMTQITESEMVGDLQNALNADYEAYVDEEITEPLLATVPAPGSIASCSEGQFGTMEMTLSNGVKVVVKQTDFKQDEILMNAFKTGGKRAYAPADAPNVLLLDDAYDTAKIGNFNQVMLEKYLAGKNLSLGYSVGNTVNQFSGKTTVKDLETFMELVYASFTEVSEDEEAYNTMVEQSKAVLKNQDKNPMRAFQTAMFKDNYGNNPMFQLPTVELLDAANYAREMELYKESVANAADYTFIFTGNVDLEALKPLAEKYLASLPSTGKASSPAQLSSIALADGIINDEFDYPMEVPTTYVYMNSHGNNVPYSIENDVKVDLVGDVLSNIYTDTLREEEGGTYSPNASGGMNPFTGTWQIQTMFLTNDQIQKKLIDRANEEYAKLLSEGADQTNFNKVREAALKQYEINVRTNNYWLSRLTFFEMGFDTITNHLAAIEGLTLDDFNSFMKTLDNGKNKVTVVMTGVAQ